jgi:uncharacterized membrane protein YhhN
MIWLFPMIAVFTLAGLLYYGEWLQESYWKWIFKPLTSLLFLLVGLTGGFNEGYLLAGHKGGFEYLYSKILFLGLFLCFWGDLFLIPASKKCFLTGLVSFLLGHVAYILAFMSYEDKAQVDLTLRSERPLLLDLLPIAIFSGIVFLWLRPKLGEMKIPVLVYVIVITVMVWSAWSVFRFSNEEPFRYILLGAVSFYFSDLAVAIDRFVNSSFTNRLWGLPLYYLGQFLLALSIHYH